MGVEDLRLLDKLVVASTNRVRLLVHELVVGKFDVIGREFLSVMPSDSPAEKEGNDRFRAGFHLPGFGQISDEVLEISVVFDQPVENEPGDITGSRVL